MKAQVECFCCNIRQTQEAVEKAGKTANLPGRYYKRYVLIMLMPIQNGRQLL